MPNIGSYELIEPADWLFPGNGDVRDGVRRAEKYFSEQGSYEGAELQIEEFVRQWALKKLLDKYSYPEEWIGERIIIEEPVKMGSTEKQADISIKNTNRRTFLYIETKKRGISEEEFLEAERQLETYLASTHTATIGIVTDGDRVRTLRKKIDPNDFDYIADLPSFSVEARTKLQLVREIPEGGNARATGLDIITDKYSRVLFECHNAIRDADGLHDDEALDELCKVLYTKIFDERNTVKQEQGTPFAFQTYGASNASEVASNIRVLYEDARNADIEIYSKRIPGYERSRGVFKAQIRLSDAALFRVVEGLQDFSLVDSVADIKGGAFQQVLAPAIRAGMGQYFTPDPIVELVVKLLQPKATDLILDPFCGSGHFLTKCLEYVMEHQGSSIDEHGLHEFKFFHLHGIEKSERMVRIAMTDMMLHDDGHTNIRNQDALLTFDNYPDIIALRDDGESDPAVFDIVVTNPPFGSIMRQEVMEMVGRFELGHKKKSLPLEVLGLERSVHFLKPGGRLAIVLPEHLLKGKSMKYVREWLPSTVEIVAAITLPEETFNRFGAMVKTCLCLFRKLEKGEKQDPENNCFLCQIDNLGYDATGRTKAGSEVNEVVDEFFKSGVASWKN